MYSWTFLGNRENGDVQTEKVVAVFKVQRPQLRALQY